jgi:PDZ domain-containing protein
MAVIAASVIEVPYYGIAPGDASPVAPRLEVDGAPTFSSSGEVLFVTVSEPHLTALGALQGWLDPDIDVVSEKQLFGDQSAQQNQQTNLRLMGYSKDFATFVALQRLGYDVKVSDGGVAIDSLCMKFNQDGSCAGQSPAASALQVHDLITAINGTPVNLPSDISLVLTGKKPGDKVNVTVTRDGAAKPVNVPVTLTKTDDGRTILGIIPDPSPPDTIKFQFPIQINIDSGAVGGPSAGLAFTLALLDELTPGDLFGGHKVAATGTISPNGTVGEIGGLAQKTVAVERQGADLFLVPKSEMADAVAKAKGTKLKVVGVETLDDALAALKAIGGSGLPAATAQTPG